MSDLNTRLQTIVDEYEIMRVRRIWAYSRDHADWDALAACFHPDATVTISWYSGTALGFIERSKEAAAGRKPQERSAHWIGDARATVNGDRAVLEMDVQILSRDYLDGLLFDCVCYARFYDLFGKRNGEWRISRWDCIYDKDRLDPVTPGVVPESFMRGSSSTTRTTAAHSCDCGRQEGASGSHRSDHGRQEDEKRLKAQGRAWLDGRIPRRRSRELIRLMLKFISIIQVCQKSCVRQQSGARGPP